MQETAFLDKLTPSTVEIAGVKISLFFSMRAAVRMEKELERAYYEIVEEMLQLPGEDGQTPPPMTIDRQITVICILMEEAGMNVEREMLDDLHMAEFARLARAAQREMLWKLPRGDSKKNDRRGVRPSGGQS